MAVVRVRQRRAREMGLREGERTAIRVWLVQVSDTTDGPDVALVADGVHQRGTPYSYTRPELLCTDVDCREVEDAGGLLFEVTSTYSDKRESEQQTPGEPTAKEQTVRFGFTEFTETATIQESSAPVKVTPTASGFTRSPLTNWKWGKAIVNSAGQTFDPSIERVYYDLTITINRNEPDWDLARQVQYQNAINEDDFYIAYRKRKYLIRKGQARMANIGAEGRFENSITFFEATYEIQIREDGWGRRVLDEGRMELNNGDIPQRPIRDSEGQPVTYPVMLDGVGQKLANGATPVFLEFTLNKQRVFGDLKLG